MTKKVVADPAKRVKRPSAKAMAAAEDSGACSLGPSKSKRGRKSGKTTATNTAAVNNGGGQLSLVKPTGQSGHKVMHLLATVGQVEVM